MENRYQVFDAENKNLYVGVCSHYFKVSDAKKVYRNSLKTEGKDDSLLIEIATNNSEEVEGAVIFGVEEGEQFALALLNLCNSIKR